MLSDYDSILNDYLLNRYACLFLNVSSNHELLNVCSVNRFRKKLRIRAGSDIISLISSVTYSDFNRHHIIDNMTIALFRFKKFE